METVLLLALVAVCGLLTVTLLGVLRSVAAVHAQLQLGNRAVRSPANDLTFVGRELVGDLANRLPWKDDDGLIVFLDSSCPMCEEFLALLPQIQIANVALGVRGTDAVHPIPSTGLVLAPDLTETLFEMYEFEYIPFGIHQREGVILGTIHTEALTNAKEIHNWWTHSGATLREVAA